MVNSLPCAAGAMNEEALRGMHPLQALLRTLLPWVNAGQAPDYAAQEEAAEEEGGAAGEAAASALDRATQEVLQELQAREARNGLHADSASELDEDELHHDG
jgi:hypothetical protein